MSKKVLLLAKSVTPVRNKIYEIISEKYDLTIAYTGTVPKDLACKSIKIEDRSIKGFKFYKNNIKKLIKQYDAVIVPMDYRMIDIDILMAFKHPCKMIAWGIGVPASYTVRYDDPTARNLMPFYVKKADAVLFYTEYPRQKYIKSGYPAEKMFVANNTVSVNGISPDRSRNSLLFVGSLYPAKKADVMIDAYCKLKEEGLDLMPLNIVGTGSEEQKLKEQVASAGLEDIIKFYGAIYNDDELQPLFEDAYALLSPGQAGLSVLKSMGYGVPFVTTRDAYTGGERLNITHDVNGILMEKEEDIKELIRDIHTNPQRFIELGKNAYSHYMENCRPDQMAQGFIDAIDYVLNDKGLKR